MEHPIKDIMSDTLAKMKEMVDSNTVIGKPVMTPDGTTILPVSRISFGFVQGGSDFATEKQKDLFGGAASSGATIAPVGFLVIKGESVRLIQLAEGGATIDRVLNMMPEVIDKVEGFISKDKKKDSLTDEEIRQAVADAKAAEETAESTTETDKE